MKKRVVLFLNFILLVGCVLFFVLEPALAGPIRCEFGGEQEVEELLASARESEELFFSDLAFSGEKLPFDRTTSTFYLPLNMEVAAWETGTLTSLSPDVQILFAEDFTGSDKQEAIRKGQRFRFYAVRGQEYQECGLVVTGLPVISIETEAEADAEVFGGMAYFWDSGEKRNWTSASIMEGNIRGNTSRTYPKKGYRLALKKQDKSGAVVPEKKSLFGLREDDEWILNAMYSDDSKIRDKLSADVWNSFGSAVQEFPGAKFGTDAVYVEVFFNQEYWGLYSLMEPVDSKQLDLGRAEEGRQTEYSYKAVVTQTIPTGELDNVEAFGEELAGFELKGRYTNIDRSHWEPLISYLKLRDLSGDEAFAREAPQQIDVQGALNVWIYFQAVLGIDNRAKNMYYVAKSSNQNQKIYFVPWDMDVTWGDGLTEGTGDQIWNVGLHTNLYSERINWTLGDRLIELHVDGAPEYVADAWRDLRQGIFSAETLTQTVDSLVHQVRDSGALSRDRQRWPGSNFGADYERFKRMALYRMEILDYYFDGRLEAYMGLGYE